MTTTPTPSLQEAKNNHCTFCERQRSLLQVNVYLCVMNVCMWVRMCVCVMCVYDAYYVCTFVCVYHVCVSMYNLVLTQYYLSTISVLSQC